MAGPWDLTGRTVVITGANSGIGLEAAAALAAMGARVVITARHPERGRRALERLQAGGGPGPVELRALDLADLASVREFARDWTASEDRLDALINNAGGILSERRTTRDGFEMTFGVNHLGHFLLTSLLLDQLRDSAPARIVNVASLAHRGGRFRPDDLNWQRRAYRGSQAYNDSKLHNVLFTVELARRLEGTGVTANACHPGPVRTEFGSAEDTRGAERVLLAVGRPFMIGPRSGARPLVELAADPRWADVSGRYFSRWPLSAVPGAPVRPHRPSGASPDRARVLWERSEQLLASTT